VEDYTVNLFTNKSEMITTPTSLDPQPALSAYPNPARDYINVRLTNWTQPVEIRLTDLAGRTIFSQKTADNAISLNVAGYNKGIYLMEVTDGASRAFQKVIIH